MFPVTPERSIVSLPSPPSARIFFQPAVWSCNAAEAEGGDDQVVSASPP